MGQALRDERYDIEPETRPGRRILVADDDSDAREGMRTLLELWGYQVETASDGRAALDRVPKIHPSLVITDVVMPRMSGLELLEAIRRELPTLPVIVMTAHGTLETQAAIRDAGVQDGMVLVNCLHTTCSIVITDSDTEDFVGLMARLIGEEGAYRHNDLRWSDCERGNAAAHLRASLLGHGVAIGIVNGTLALDDEQAILLAEWDGPRSRTVNIHILGA